MSEQCNLYDRNCIDCGECDNCDLDSSKHCDDCGRCLNLTDEYITVKVSEFIKSEEKKSNKIYLSSNKKNN